MATKIKLGNRPKNFKHTVTFPMLDGTTGSIEVTYKYRTRKEFGLFIDKIINAAGEKKDSANEEKFSMAALMEKTADSNADYVMQVVDAWNLDEELTRENAQQLCDELPAATAAIMEDYRKAIAEGRLGN
jgi:hypothetical protein